MRIPIWQVDAFVTGGVFTGNPAAVCPLDAWLPDATLLAIAAENALSETAFLVPEGEGWHLRWFTPEVEVELCGHATLASAHVVFEHLARGRDAVAFRTQAGTLTVTRDAAGRIALSLPRRPPAPAGPPPALVRALGGRAPDATLLGRDYLAVLATEQEVRLLKPDLGAVSELPGHGIVVTAPASTPGVDFVSRYFAPQVGIPEDPVTGSAHCTLVPYWADRLGRRTLEALQVSRRGGRLACEDQPDAGKVRIAGRAAEFLSGFLEV
ncbi:phenazine biosynthesis protein PhzF family [Anaeromyxobacter sp. K]|uniref:PhzF family phenazine biosynthesis protein n=1 Tax=Anaeromyxobacter sp. (strain K) TaxID=447217 RepID=UPI00015F9F86|nr:PhzF family phenazine biosynthesis protein [Anaeromyxobacter sp. K]ACG71847.1 phenazine biosynthesis protein PhzF family [Anaeromyxobacter sp. K]